MEHRIAVIGYSGSGKSTLGRRLADQYGCEVLHLDCVHWLPGWKERDNAEKEEIVSAFMDYGGLRRKNGLGISLVDPARRKR